MEFRPRRRTTTTTAAAAATTHRRANAINDALSRSGPATTANKLRTTIPGVATRRPEKYASHVRQRVFSISLKGKNCSKIQFGLYKKESLITPALDVK